MANQQQTEVLLDPDSRLVNVSTFDFLLIELVPLAERMARAYEASLDRPVPSKTSTTAKRTSRGPPGGQITTAGNAPATAQSTTSSVPHPSNLVLPGSDSLPSTQIFTDSIYVRLERLGFRVGQGLSEKFSRDRPRFNTAGINDFAGIGGGQGMNVGNVNDVQLDVIKFLCKDIWTVVWRKQVDNLKTNHRVSHILQYRVPPNLLSKPPLPHLTTHIRARSS
jgi:trafficking protein particle complex subunit 6